MEFLLLVIAVALIYIAYKMPKKDSQAKEEQVTEAMKKKERRIAQQLPTLVGATCEFEMLDLVSFESGMTGKGTVVDFDDEWVLVSQSSRKGEMKKMIRIAQISDVKAISGPTV